MRAFRLLLRLYPASFRGEYGDQMAADFAERRRRSSGAGAAGLWLEAIADAIVAGPRAHLDLLRQDLRTTWRGFRRAPGFAMTAVLVAGLGIGATTAAFSIADHVLLRPLPFPDSDRLVNLWQEQSYRGYPRLEFSPPNYLDWRRMLTTLDSGGAWRGLSVNLVGSGTPEHIDGAAVTADLLPTLGVHPAIGRVFSAADDVDGAPGTVLLSAGLWRTRFGGDAGVLGRVIRLDDTPYTVIGIMPAAFTYPNRDVRLWVPMQFKAGDLSDRTNIFLQAVGRLKAGISVDQARADARRVAGELARAYPKENSRTGGAVTTLREDLSSRSRTLLLALAGASACVLLIACSNLASLLLARALGRRRELAVRAALGAGRERLVRQLLTESAVLAIGGAMIGVALAAAAVPVLTTLAPTSLPIADVPPLDVRLLSIVTLITIATAVGLGAVPALRAGRTGRAGAGVDALQEGARAGTGRRTERLRGALVVVQIAASVTLLVASALLLRALWRLEARPPGFDTSGVLMATAPLPMPKYETVARRDALYDRVLEDVRQQPGVESAAFISFVPMSPQMRGGIFNVTLEGHPQDPTTTHVASIRYVTPGFFRTMDIPILRGRDIAAADTPASPWVAVVSEKFARENWPGESALGRTFDLAFHDRTVVGVVGDVLVRGVERPSEPQAYMPAAQMQDRWLTWFAPKDLVVKSAIEPAALASTIRRIVHDADSDLPVTDIAPLDAVVDADNTPRKVQVRVLGGFAAVACVLAALGLHGLLSFSVSARTREIGLRMALGASRGSVLTLVVRRSAMLAGIGLLIGVALASLAGASLRALLAGVNPFDAEAFVVASGLALAMAGVGTLAPSLRAMRIDPLVAIRDE
jgi:putative ABC transport system permease protein